MKEDKYKELRESLAYFETRRARATERLAADGDLYIAHFTIIGIESESFELTVPGIVKLRCVDEPPGEVELASALADKQFLSSVGRYSHRVHHELCVERSIAATTEKALDLGWLVITALRIRTTANFLVPAVSDYSWSTIAAAPKNSCHIQLLEDFPMARTFGEISCITQDDLEWAVDHVPTLKKVLLENPRIQLAVECLTTHHHEASLRMTAASLWTGLESLIGISAELSFRISLYIAAFLETPGGRRIALYRHIKSLYSLRSKVVHGAEVDNKVLAKHIKEVKTILSRLIINIIDSGEFPVGDKWDEILLG
jgi:hypothetical protein